MERRRDRGMLVWAVAASIFLHVAVALSLAAFGNVFTPTPNPDAEDRPPELTLVDLAATPPPEEKRVNPAFIETPDARKSDKAPDEKPFISNENSIAASSLPAAGSAPLPTLNGEERPGLDMQSQAYSLPHEGNNAARPQPTPPPTPTPPPATPEPTPVPTPKRAQPVDTPEPEQLAMLRPTPPTISTPAPETSPQMRESPPPAPTAAPSPPQPASSYRRQQIPTRLRGNISNRGVDSVDAVGTPLGRYQKLLSDAVGKNWYANVEKQRDLVNIGTVHLRFVIDRDGRINPAKMKVISNSSNEAFAGVCLASVQDVRMPPLTDDIAASLPPEGLEVDFNFTMAPNRQ
jgi:hypothetical protein